MTIQTGAKITILSFISALFLTGSLAQAQAEPSGSATFSADEIQQTLRSLGADAETLGEGMAKGIASVIAKYGQPTGLIVGGEFQGSLIVGYRKGSGQLLFKGQAPEQARKIFWEAPSIGFGAGATASKVCLLIYGTRDHTQVLGHFASGQGSAHWLAGGSISVLSNLAHDAEARVSLVDVAVGVGFDLTARLEGLTFTTEDSWLPF